MKIGLVRRGFSGTGGAEAYLMRLAHGLTQAGHEAILITSEEWPAERWPGRGIIRLPGRTPDEFATAFAASKAPVDITFSLERVPGCDVYRAGDGVHAAWIQRRSVFEPWWKVWFHRYNPKHIALIRLERGVYRTVRAVIANSRMVADEIVHWHGCPRKKIHIVPNGIGSALAAADRAESRSGLGLDEGYLALFAGSGWERKGLAFALAAAEKADAKVLVAGRGKKSAYSSPAAIFLGPVTDLSPVFAAADVFILPTIYDPFSNACLEALAAGLPVITTTANGFSEIITPGVHGSVVEPGDVKGLAEALRYWKTQDRAATAKACRELAAQYSIERNVRETLAVLTGVLQP